MVSQQQQQVKYPQFWVSWVGTKKALIRPIWVSRQMLARWIARLWLVSGSNEGKNSIVVCVEQSILYHKEFAQCIKIHQNDSFPFLNLTQYWQKSIENIDSGNLKKWCIFEENNTLNCGFPSRLFSWALVQEFAQVADKVWNNTKSNEWQNAKVTFKTPIVWGEKSMEENLDFFSWNNI